MRLGPLPEGFDSTRRALHQLAYFVIAPKRYAAMGKLGLRCTNDGFGTPVFRAEEQVRFEQGWLVWQRGSRVDQIRVESLGQACDFVEIPYREVWFEDFGDPLVSVGADTKLDISPEPAAALVEWFLFASDILEELPQALQAAEVSEIQLWPEHFDVAVEMGPEPRRGTYGASPGDHAHDEPYLYVAAWEKVDRSQQFWNDLAFNGASLPYRHLLEATDQRSAVLDFFQRGYKVLSG